MLVCRVLAQSIDKDNFEIQEICHNFRKKQKSPSQNVDKCSEVHTVGLSEIWSHLIDFFVRFFESFKLLDNLLARTV